MMPANQVPVTLDVAERALSFVKPDDRDVWIRMGMALKAEFGDSARDIWLDWSAAADSYDPGAAKASWKSFKHGGKITIGSLFAAAKDGGFVFDREDIQVSPEQLAAQQREREERAAKAEADRKQRAEAAAKRAQSQWRMAAVDGESPYLERKQVAGEACRYLKDGSIIVPMYRYDTDPPTMVGKQQIDADGSKKYSGGMDKAGAACLLGNMPEDGELILFCEGYATGLSLRAANAVAATVVAFDTSGLLAAAKIFRALCPSSPFLICADDDYLTGGKGLEKAQEAAQAVGNAAVVLPRFTAARRQSKNDESLPMLTDFNDLHVAESLEAVAEQLDAAIADLMAPPPAPTSSDAEISVTLPTVSPAPLPETAGPDSTSARTPLETALEHCALVQGTTDVWDSLNKLRMKRAAFVALVGKEVAKQWESHTYRRTISPRNLPKVVRGIAVDEGVRGDDGLVGMLDRFTFLYGTKTVWDGEKRKIIAYDALSLSMGSDLTSRWLEHPLRRTIDYENLVFDPTQRVDLATHINMFEGFPLKPKKDEAKAELVLHLLWSLVSSEKNAEEVFKWVLRWLAYPLQHPGAKMQTALLFFGEKQGTGKSLFFEGIVKPIYGAHGATGGQHQLDAQYTMWRSQKLFVLFEEILSRQDKYSHFGLIKHMVTGRDTQISQKFKDDRVEANHMNCVMLSNEFQAVPLEPEDRRFLVVDVRTPLDPELLEKIKAALGQGLTEAFYAFLLEYPLGDFSPHTKPVMTPSKQRVIDFGLPDWEAFYRAWSGSELDAPYCSCLTTDLHVVYSRYCSRYGFRSMSLTKFSELIAQRVEKDRQWISLGAKAKKLLSVFRVPPPDGSEAESLSKQCERFRNLADIKE